MNLKWIERPNSRRMRENPQSIILEHQVIGTTDDGLARAYALSNTSLMYAGLWRQNIEINPSGFQIWDVTTTYGPTQPIAEVKWSFDTGDATATITQAKQHIASYVKEGETAPDHKGAIGVNGDEVEGCEVAIPQFKWAEERKIPIAAAAFPAYSQILKALAKHVNSAMFRGFPAGEVRFDGATGGQSSRDPNYAELTFRFTQQDSITNATVGEITGINVTGWQYWWAEYETVYDTIAKRNVRRPRCIHVERVYDAADLSLLGIGIGPI